MINAEVVNELKSMQKQADDVLSETGMATQINAQEYKDSVIKLSPATIGRTNSKRIRTINNGLRTKIMSHAPTRH